ncbi:hypothetical protein [Microbacterium elymi]|uniref:DUF222 domain-containing protein n=1 Tax=Microbacterium elymi TaxID=2909587 RepID=A0ABY5NHW3_9MICO|nr:hypothetical protein [Microbacterium elymi]UUT34733.1 hypothetical protein L2X98_30200 [Microbacterium elymi]
MDIASPPLLETLTRLDAALGDAVGGALGDDSPRTMTDADAIALARIAESLGRRVDALRLVAAGEIDERSRPELGAERLSGRHGCVNAIDLLTRLTGVASGTAHTRVQTARLIATRTTLTGQPRPAHFPAIREAVIDGTMGLDGAAAISRVLGPIADRCAPGHLAVAESELVDAATGTGASDAPACTADETRLAGEGLAPLPRPGRHSARAGEGPA